jgi:uncharacterized protein YbaR (Trm112 family)/SAM-dependent methyltransferase
MRASLLELLRCPFCGSRITVVENEALERADGRIDAGVLGCDCCAYPVIAGIPVLIADDTTRTAMHLLEAGRREEALFTLLGLDAARGASFRALLQRGHPTYRELLPLLSLDAEAENFLYRFSDPTYVMAEALLRAVGQTRWTVSRPVLDVCGGSGHLTRVLAGLRPAGGVVDADVYFWKLWLARRFNVPDADTVCCDANSPLPFAPDSFSMVVLADAFPYIWHKRLLADELIRAAGPDGVVVMPHLHSSLGENFSAGMTLTPEGYRDLFAQQEPRLFSDARLFDDALQGRVDLTRALSPAQLGDEPSFTLVASRHADLFRAYDVPASTGAAGTLTLNPLYRVERRDGASVLTLTFPTPEYEEEFGECKRYLPASLTIEGDVTAPIDPSTLGAAGAELRRRRVILDAPPDYC